MINILIADDHAVVRRGLKQILQEHPDLVVGGEAANATEVLELVQAKSWDVLVLDITMPGRSGLDILRDLKHLAPHLPVLVLSMHAEDQFATRVLKSGAAGYLPKETAPDELVKAIRKVLAGGKYVSPTQAEKLAVDLGADLSQPLHANLSDREFEILCLIGSGRTPTQIALQLSLSAKTISTYRARILAKMKLQTNAELTHYAFQHRLVE